MYLDYNAMHPLRPTCKEFISSYVQSGNPSSVHQGGRYSRSLIDQARQKVAHMLNVSHESIVWTSGATEANNLMLQGFQGPVVVSAAEHDSVYYARKDAIICPVHSSGLVDLVFLDKTLQVLEEPFLVSIAAAHNETGIIQPMEDIYQLVKRYKGFLHSDCTQVPGRIAWPQADSFSLSGHKMGGLPGCGALISEVPLKPLMYGGGQERFLRPGTENILGIMTFACALGEALADDWSNTVRIEDILKDVIVVGKGMERLPNTSLLIMPGVLSATQVMHFDLKGIYVSSGSACSSGKVRVSRTLEAMKIDHRECALRVSSGANLTNISLFCDAWTTLYKGSA